MTTYKTKEELEKLTTEELIKEYTNINCYFPVWIQPKKESFNLSGMKAKDFLKLLADNPEATLEFTDKTEGTCHEHYHNISLELVNNLGYDHHRNYIIEEYLKTAKRLEQNEKSRLKRKKKV